MTEAILGAWGHHRGTEVEANVLKDFKNKANND